MANLDSFFAKKDKKKKGGKKFTGTSAAEMAKALETPEPPPPAETEKKEFQIDLPSIKSADDEWHEVEEKEKDLEGLKIRSLRVDDPEEGGAGEKPVADKTDEDSDHNESSEVTTTTTTVSPWQVVTPQVDPEPEEELKPERSPSPSPPPSPPPAEEETEKKPAAYVPPSLRNRPPGERASGSSEPYRPSGTRSSEPYRPPGYAARGAYRAPGRRGNAPPDIENTEAFPSLGAS